MFTTRRGTSYGLMSRVENPLFDDPLAGTPERAAEQEEMSLMTMALQGVTLAAVLPLFLRSSLVPTSLPTWRSSFEIRFSRGGTRFPSLGRASVIFVVPIG